MVRTGCNCQPGRFGRSDCVRETGRKGRLTDERDGDLFEVPLTFEVSLTDVGDWRDDSDSLRLVGPSLHLPQERLQRALHILQRTVQRICLRRNTVSVLLLR